MKNDRKTVYRSKVDWWVWCVMIFALVVIWAASLGSQRWVLAVNGGGMMLLLVVLFMGCWYEVDGDRLVIYQFFMPHRYPIGKIKEVKKTTGYLATAGMSKDRVSIKFVDRSVTKSVMPIEISPKDRDGFMAQLKAINPEIITA